jgi:hypothetical protein
MPEIGETLREARMRAKIDVSEVEAATKIRAKYLRALENEEWGLLPGSTFVRSFLRTYADYLGLDSKLLVEEYRLSHEGPSELDLAPIAPNLGPERVRLPAPRLSRGWIVGLSLAGLVVLLIVLGSVGGGGKSGGGGGKLATRKPAGKHRVGATPQAAAPAPAPVPVTAQLQLVPTDRVYVCLVDSSGRRLIDGQIVDPGAPPQTFTAKGFSVLFGHGPQGMKLNGRSIGVPASSDPVGYAITPTGRHALSQAKLPTCSQ